MGGKGTGLSSDAEIRQSCARLAHQFCVFADLPDGRLAAGLFAEDGVFQRGEVRAEGRAAIAEMFQARPAEMMTRHAMTTSVIDVEAPGRARGRHYCLVHVSGANMSPATPILRDYRDTYQLTADGWKIASRVVTTPFETSAR